MTLSCYLALICVGLVELFGINCFQFHFCFCYGDIENIFHLQIGKVLKKLFEDGVVKREKLFITSKIWYLVYKVYVTFRFLTHFQFPSRLLVSL